MKKDYAELEQRILEWFDLDDAADARDDCRDDDRTRVRPLVRRIVKRLEERDIPPDPAVEIRLVDVVTWWHMTYRLQLDLRDQLLVTVYEPDAEPEAEGNPDASPTPQPTRKARTRRRAIKAAWTINPCIELLAKSWDRLRKAREGLEAVLTIKPAPVFKGGLPYLMKPLMKQAEGIMEDAIEYEEKRLRRKAERERRNATGNAR